MSGDKMLQAKHNDLMDRIWERGLATITPEDASVEEVIIALFGIICSVGADVPPVDMASNLGRMIAAVYPEHVTVVRQSSGTVQ